MKIKLIDFGLKADHHPFRPHDNDAGADVFMPYDCTLQPGEIARIPLGFGLIIPDGFAGYVFPRSSMAKKDWYVSFHRSTLAIVVRYMPSLVTSVPYRKHCTKTPVSVS